MKKTYFVRRNVYNKSKNKLDQQLHEAFLRFDQKTVTDDNLEIFDIMFQDVVGQYKAAGGRCEAPNYYRRKQGASYEVNPTIFIHVSETCSYILYPILGEINLQTVIQP